MGQSLKFKVGLCVADVDARRLLHEGHELIAATLLELLFQNQESLLQQK